MKKRIILGFVVLAAAAGIFFLGKAMAAPSTPSTTPSPTLAQASASAKYPPPPGVGIAQTLSTITGVAISPLLGVSAVGCYQWCKAPEDQRDKLPWFASPLFWVPAFLLLAACLFKDTAGTALGPAKKPFDALEAVEHKISTLVATGAFVPIMVGIIHEANSTGGQPTLSLSALGFAAVSLPNWLYDILVVPVAMAVFLIVALASNAINVLILLSPFPPVDAALKTFRASVLASVVGTYAVGSWTGHPWIGAIWALVIILISYLIAGWSLRLSHFGLVFVWEFFTGGRYRFKPDEKTNSLFLGRKAERVPTRTFGRLARNDRGELVFNYRPWLVLPQRALILPPGNYEAGRGLFYSEIMRVEGDSARTVFLLPPRYRGHEEEIARIYNLAGTRNIGLRAAWTWFKGLFGSQPAQVKAATNIV